MDPKALTIWRSALLLITAAECTIQTSAGYWQAQFRPTPIAPPYGWVAHNLVVTILLATMTVIALWRFLGPRASLAAGFVALAGLKIGGETFERVFMVHHQDFYQGGALLIGALIGESYARMLGVRAEGGRLQALEARRFGMTGALAMLAASYMAAGSSKVLTGGISWATSAALRLMILSHSDVEGGLLATAIPNWAAASPHLCLALEMGTLVVQLGAFMLIVGPRARRLWASLIVAFHLGIYLTSHILFVTPMLFAAVVAFPWARVLPGGDDNLDDLHDPLHDPGEVPQRRARPAARGRDLVILAGAVVLAMRIAHGW